MEEDHLVCEDGIWVMRYSSALPARKVSGLMFMQDDLRDLLGRVVVENDMDDQQVAITCHLERDRFGARQTMRVTVGVGNRGLGRNAFAARFDKQTAGDGTPYRPVPTGFVRLQELMGYSQGDWSGR
jgi:hypothetical protein